MKGKLGKITKEDEGYKVQLERVFPHNIDLVWQAITDPNKLRIWFTDIEMQFVEGGEMKIYFRDAGNEVSLAKIISIDPPHKFSFSWEGELAVFELFEESKNSCKLIFTYSKFTEDFKVKVPAGWHILMDQLQVVLGGHTEPFPFGAGPTEEGKNLQELYLKTLNN